MKRVLFFAGLAGALVGCGSGMPSAPALPNFNYGAPSATLSSDQTNVATQGESGLGTASGVNGQTSDPEQAAFLADRLGTYLPSPAMVAVPSPQAALASLPFPGSESAASSGRSAAVSVSSACVTKTASTWTYSNCSFTGDGFTWTLNGSIAIATGSLTWDISATFSGNSNGVSGAGQFHWAGHLAWTTTSVTGQGRSELAIKADGQGEHVELGETTGWNANLQVDATSHCVTGGTLEIGRAIEANASNGQHVSSATGWKFTWSGCHNVQVAVGT